METKFSKFLLVKERAVDACENKIFSCNASIASQKEVIAALLCEIKNYKMPPQGDFTLYLRAQEVRAVMYRVVNEEQEKLLEYEQMLERLKIELKAAMMELERAKYLNNLEVEKILKAKKVAEAKELDEISVMLFNNNRRGY